MHDDAAVLDMSFFVRQSEQEAREVQPVRAGTLSPARTASWTKGCLLLAVLCLCSSLSPKVFTYSSSCCLACFREDNRDVHSRVASQEACACISKSAHIDLQYKSV